MRLQLPRGLVRETTAARVGQGLRSSAGTLGERLADDDRATLAVLTDSADARSAWQRPDLEVHVGRTLVLARRR